MEKLSLKDIEEIDNAHPLERFRRGIKTDGTLRSYNSALKSVLCTALEDALQGTYEERAAEFVEIGKKNPIRARNIITQLVKAWSKQAELDPSDSKHMSPGTIRAALNPIKKLMDMNDVALAWKMVYEMCPERSHNGPMPGWTDEAIRKMLEVTTSRLMRAAIRIRSPFYLVFIFSLNGLPHRLSSAFMVPIRMIRAPPTPDAATKANAPPPSPQVAAPPSPISPPVADDVISAQGIGQTGRVTAPALHACGKGQAWHPISPSGVPESTVYGPSAP